MSRVKIDLVRAEQIARSAAEKGVQRARMQGERELAEVLSGDRSGRAYTRGSVTRIASAPGEAPATDSGDLRQSAFSDQRTQGLTVKGRVGVSAKHGEHLELGTENIAPRPFISRLAAEPGRRQRIAQAFADGARQK